MHFVLVIYLLRIFAHLSAEQRPNLVTTKLSKQTNVFDKMKIEITTLNVYRGKCTLYTNRCRRRCYCFSLVFVSFWTKLMSWCIQTIILMHSRKMMMMKKEEPNNPPTTLTNSLLESVKNESKSYCTNIIIIIIMSHYLEMQIWLKMYISKTMLTTVHDVKYL